MKIIQIVPKPNVKLKGKLDSKEKYLREKGGALKLVKRDKWKHVKYHGWIRWSRGMSDIVIGEINSNSPDGEWQILQSVIGFLDRHLGNDIESINILFRK